MYTYKEKGGTVLKIVDTYLYKIYRAQKALYHAVTRDLSNLGITHDNYMTLRHIYENPGITQTELAIINDKDRNVIGRVVDKFENLNHVQRVRTKEDRRIIKLYITEEGASFIEAYWDKILECQENFLGTLTSEEKNTLVYLLDKIV